MSLEIFSKKKLLEHIDQEYGFTMRKNMTKIKLLRAIKFIDNSDGITDFDSMSSQNEAPQI